MNKKQRELKILLDRKVDLYNRPDFIDHDPVQMAHAFTKKQDIEIMSFWTAVLAWGQRKTIINKSRLLADLMDNSPHDFICNHEEIDLIRFETYKHRTFNSTDALYFISFFKDFYSKHKSLETAFSSHLQEQDENVGNALIGFHNSFFQLEDAPHRTRKHIATPARKSACKRINMFLRWMVRNDNKGVDLGIWNKIKTSQLICPLDVHVERVARHLGLIERKQRDWKTAVELTKQLKIFDPDDPVKYDFALFGMGVSEKNR